MESSNARRRGIVPRLVAAVAALAAVAGLVVVAAPTPATASAADVRWPQGSSLTWVDAQGRQHTVTQVLRPLDPPEPIWDLQVLRDTTAGQPDPDWIDSAGIAGQRTIALTAPAEGARLDPVAAADAAGSVTLVWGAAGCEQSEACDRWFQTVDVEGGALGEPSASDDVGEPLAGLPDGSVLVGTAEGPLGRRSADGTDLPLPVELPAATGAWDATVDTEGRLLLATKDGTIVRQGDGGGVDLTVDSGCDPDVGIVIGPAPGGGFATACGVIDVAPTVTRWDAAGAVSWSANDAVAPNSDTGLAWPSHIAGDGDGGVWVAGRSHPDLAQTPRAVLARFTAAGPEVPAFAQQAQRSGARGGFGMADLRPVLDRHVAFAFDDRCCDTVGGPLPFDRVISGVLPDRPSPPTCLPGAPTVEHADQGAARLGFTTCAAGRAVEEPTDYLLEVIGPEQTRSAVVDHTGPAEAVEGIVIDLYGGTLLRTQVTARNAEGASLAGPRAGASLVLPFDSVEGFTFRMYNTLIRDIWWERDGSALVAEVESGDVTPVQQVVQMLQDGVAEQRVEPVARVYLAVLGRHPDTWGLRYWVGRSEAGIRLGQIAERMADSSEFRRRYGGLTDRGFVRQLYRNVLGRAGDPAGIDYWTARLTSKRLTRGGVVTQFSQSGEFIRRSDPTVQPLAAMFLLRGRVTTEGERIAWGTAAPRTSAVSTILAYSTRAQLGG